MRLSLLSPASEHPRQRERLLAVVLAVVILGGLTLAPVVSAQPTTTNATNATGGTSSNVTPMGQNVSQTNTTATNTTTTTGRTNGSHTRTNNTSARAGGNTSRLSSNSTASNRTTNSTSANGTTSGNTSRLTGQSAGQTTLTNWVTTLAHKSPKQAKKAVENNPQKAAKMASALKRIGAKNPNKTVHQHPHKAAQKVSSIVSMGNTSANGSAQNNSSAGSGQVKLRKCSGDGFIGNAMCKASNFMFGWVIGGIQDFVQGIIGGIVDLIVGTPVPKHNGSPAFFQQPTNQPWKGLYQSWLSFSMPLGILEWAMMILGILFTQVFTSDPTTELKRRELKHRSWKVLLGVLGSWAIGATILWISNAVTLAIAPSGQDIAGNLGVFAGTVGAAGAAGLLLWFFEGILFLFILLLVLAKYAVVFVMMWSLPILLPLAAFDVGPVKLLSDPARGIIDMFIPFVFLTLPMALVLKVGYLVVKSLNQSPIAQFGMFFSGANTALILGFWVVAAVSPLFVFSHAGRIKGFAAGMLGGAALASAGETENVSEKVQNAKNHVTSNGQLNEKTDINPDNNDGTWGGPLPGGDGSDRPSMLNAGTQPEQTDGPELPGPGGGGTAASAGAGGATSTTGRTTNTSSGAGSTSGTASAGSNAGGDNAVSPEDVTQVQHPRNLPTGNYQVGHIKDNGEFQPMRNNGGLSRMALLNGRYERLNTRTDRYEEETLLVRSKEDGSYFDMDSMTYREQSYEQMSRDTSEDVLNS